MGFSEKTQFEGGDFESDNRKWVIAGIALRAPLKPLFSSRSKVDKALGDANEVGEEECSTTPTGEEAKIPTFLTCPPAPRKRKPSLKCNYGSREFFNPPDLETVFIRHVERAN